jgi:hypothetical protein
MTTNEQSTSIHEPSIETQSERQSPTSPDADKAIQADSSSLETFDEFYVTQDDLDEPVKGWPQLAFFIARNPKLAAFSRFGDLNVKSLLYYQAQLIRLRKKLHLQEKRDEEGGNEATKDFANRADSLVVSEGSAQWKLITEIRLLLKEYSGFLHTTSL